MAIPGQGSIAQAADAAGLALLFAAGKRPAASDIVRLAEALAGHHGFGIAHCPPEAEGWIELLSTGLSFDCLGLAPAQSCPLPPRAQLFGLAEQEAECQLEAIELIPGRRLAGGEPPMQLVRGMVGLGAQLAALKDVVAVCWRPAASWMEPAHFCRIVDKWLQGGAFPAMGLTTFERQADGVVASRGLAFLTGQELQLHPRAGASTDEVEGLAVQLIDELIYSGPLRERANYSGPAGEELVAAPDEAGRTVLVEWV
jgi:hypothetical protein